MAIFPLRLLTSCLALLAWGSLAAAAPAPLPEAPWDLPFNSDTNAVARAAAAVPAEPGQPAIVLLSDISYRYDEQGRETRTERLVYRIATAGAHESWSVVAKEWSPWHQQKPEIRARVITPDGRQHLLDPAVIAENGAGGNQPDLFEDERVLRAPLPATGPGAVVEEEIVVRETAPYFAGGVVRFAPFAHPVACRRARLTLDVPKTLPLAWVTRLLPQTPARDEQAATRRRLSFEYRDLPKLAEPEAGLPPDVPRIPYIAFSTGTSWADIARRYSAVVDGAIRGSDVSALVAVAAGAPSQEEAISRVLGKLAEIRYTAVELGAGGIVPRSPDETLRRRFGDCKDKAVLLVAALRALDIPAYVALLSAGEGEADIEPSLPGFGSFDHAIAVVPGSPPIWIDPTDPYSRAGDLPVADQGRLALIASPTASGLTRTPEALAADNREIETREFRLAELGAARVRETSEYHGAAERDLRSYYAVIERDQIRKELADYATNTYLARELTSFDFSPPGRLGEPFRIEIELAGARRGLTDMTEGVVAILPSDLLGRLPADLAGTEDAAAEDEAPRRNDYYFARPLTVELRYRVVAPPGFVPRALPPSASRALGTMTFSEQYAAAPDGTVTATLRLDTGKRRITPQELAVLRDKLAELSTAKAILLPFEHTGEVHLAAGRVREALAEMQRQSREAPGKALPLVRIARALLAGGLGEAARQQVRAAIAAEPSSAVAYRTLGWILQHDELGRRFGQGFERGAALAAYRKAKALDPTDFETRGDLAILLEYNDAGQRYAAGSDLPAAIAEYRSLRAELAETGLDDNLLIALLRAGRFSEVQKFADEIETTPQRAYLRLAALAATAGAAEALREAERNFSAADKPAALSSAAENLIHVRRYEEAAALYQRAGQLSPDAAKMLTLADVLRRTRRHEEVTLDPASPSTPLRRLVLLPVTPKPESLRKLFVVREGEEAPDLLELQASSNQAAQGVLEGDMPLEAALDLGLAMMRESTSGSDKTGYRVELKADLPGNGSRVAGYMVREGGEYRIAALDSVPGMLGDEALRLLRKGDLEIARQWLDWAREELGMKGRASLSGRTFATLWAKGRPAGIEEASCAAATIALSQLQAEKLRLLVACRDAAQAAKDLPRQIAFEEMLIDLYRSLSRYPEMLETARRLAGARSDDEDSFSWIAEALTYLGRWDELKSLAEGRLAQKPEDPEARLLLSDIAFATGDLARGHQILATFADAGDPNAVVLNQLAWTALFRGPTDERALEWSRRAATLSHYQSAPTLHTLATLYAEQGQTAEAYKVILQSLAARSEATPTPDDWYVFGRLAEQYGLPEVARGLYRRALPKISAAVGPFSTRNLAEARLAALGPEPRSRRAELRKPRP